MYCRECGSSVNDKMEYCLSCGFRPLNSSKYCQFCGQETKLHQEMCVSCGNNLINLSEIKFAGFWLRCVASFIDAVVIGIPLFILAFIGGIMELVLYEDAYMMDETAYMWMDSYEGISYIIGFLVGLFYYSGMHASKWQATIGKRVVGIKVTDYSGRRISFMRAVGRYLATFISGIIFYIGYIMAGFTEKKQALHDIVARTLVVKSK